ncbi:MAG: neutral zinc metallopeptidase [Acidimicrobiales bacterium]
MRAGAAVGGGRRHEPRGAWRRRLRGGLAAAVALLALGAFAAPAGAADAAAGRVDGAALTSSLTSSLTARRTAKSVRTFFGPAATPSAPSRTDLSQFMEMVRGDVGRFWSDTLGREVAATGRWFEGTRNGSISTACGSVASSAGPFYCSANTTIYISYQWANWFWTRYGDGALAYVVAHEFGHHVQQVLQIDRFQRDANFELQADCFSGAYNRDARGRGWLQAEEENEALRLAGAIGDSGPSDDPHGTGAERQEAFRAGLDHGHQACIDWYTTAAV